jgi:hypothetical protein
MSDAYAAIAELVERSKGWIETCDGEWGRGMTYEALLEEGDEDAVLVAKVERQLAALVQGDDKLLENSTPPTDTEREALAKRLELYADQAEIADEAESEFSRDMNMAATLLRRQGPITDEAADAANQAWHDFVWGPDEPLSQRDLGITRQAWKVAIEAAERAR